MAADRAGRRKGLDDGEWAFGFTTSFRMGQILRYRLDPPPREEGQALEAYLATAWVDHVRHILTDGGWLQTREGRADGGTFLVGHAGRLFVIEDDFQVGEAIDGFAAVGSGAQVALGALRATRAWRDRHKRVLTALEAAERHNAGCPGPVRDRRDRPGPRPLSARGGAVPSVG